MSKEAVGHCAGRTNADRRRELREQIVKRFSIERMNVKQRASDEAAAHQIVGSRLHIGAHASSPDAIGLASASMLA
jgi:hypothetical protein